MASKGAMAADDAVPSLPKDREAVLKRLIEARPDAPRPRAQLARSAPATVAAGAAAAG